jgi:hypothetical protein
VIISGDHVAHGIAVKDGRDDPVSYQLIHDTITKSSELLNEYFPNSLVVPTLGNNDNRLHDNATTDADKGEFFPFLYDLWINGLTGNASLKNDSQIKDTFYNGAYYKVDINEKVSVLALNSMYWGFANDLKVEGPEPADMMNWLQEQFDNAGSRKFILTSHIYAGTRYTKEDLLNLDMAN